MRAVPDSFEDGHLGSRDASNGLFGQMEGNPEP